MAARTRTTPLPASKPITPYPVVPVSSRTPAGASSSRAPSAPPISTDDIDADWGVEPDIEPARARSDAKASSGVISSPPITDKIDSDWSGVGGDDSTVRDALRSPAVPKEARAAERAPSPLLASPPQPASLSRPPAPEWTPAPKGTKDNAAASSAPEAPVPAASSPPVTASAPASASRAAESRTSGAPASAPTTRSGLPAPALVALLLVAAVALWFVFRGEAAEPQATGAEVSPNAPSVVEPSTPRAPEPAPATAPPLAQPQATASGAAASAPQDPAAAASDKVVVVVKIRPEDAKLYRKGKEVGSSGVAIELAPGERRSFEVGKPGYVTRKLILDGTQSEVSIGLRPESATQ